MGHHHHHHTPSGSQRMLLVAIVLNVVFVAVEAGFGFAVGSLALLADAGHNLSDVFGLLLAWGAIVLAGRPATPRFTYGYRKVTIMAALASSLLLLIALGGMGWEAIRRLQEPADVPGQTVLAVAAIGVVINTLSALMLMKGSHDDLNMRGAFLHMAADAGVSIGVVIAGGLIIATGWHWLDPAISLVIVLLVFLGSWGLLRDSARLSIDAAPANIDVAAVQQFLLDRPGVDHMHDFHIWAMSTTETALTAHLVMPDAISTDEFLHDLAHELDHRFGIHHTTIQIERGNGAECALAADGRV